MKKIIYLLIISLFLCLFGCSKQPESNFIQIEFDSVVYERVSSNEYGQIKLKDSSGYEFGHLSVQLGTVSTNDDGVISMDNNTDYLLVVQLNPEISGENLKCYYNGTLLDLKTYNSFYHDYRFEFKSAAEHKFKVEGLSKDLKRKMSVSLPISNENYTVYHNSEEINESNKNIQIEYRKDLVVTIVMKANVEPYWNFVYEKEGHSFNGATEEETTINNDNSKTFTIIMDFNITRTDISIIPIQ